MEPIWVFFFWVIGNEEVDQPEIRDKILVHVLFSFPSIDLLFWVILPCIRWLYLVMSWLLACCISQIKRDSSLLLILQVLRSLPIKSLSCKIVAKRPALSLEGFLREYFLSGSPVIISDCMAHWPARTKWNDLDYLKRVAGDRTVPVEVINFYCCCDKFWI